MTGESEEVPENSGGCAGGTACAENPSCAAASPETSPETADSGAEERSEDASRVGVFDPSLEENSNDFVVMPLERDKNETPGQKYYYELFKRKLIKFYDIPDRFKTEFLTKEAIMECPWMIGWAPGQTVRKEWCRYILMFFMDENFDFMAYDDPYLSK